MLGSFAELGEQLHHRIEPIGNLTLRELVGAHLEILGDGQAGEDVLGLRNKTYTFLNQRMGSKVRNHIAVQPHGTFTDRDQAEHGLE